MQRTIISVLVALMVFGGAAMVSGAEPTLRDDDWAEADLFRGIERFNLPAPGVLPGSPLFFFERLFEGIGDIFTFGEAAKARRAVAIAEERLSEARALAERGDENVQMAMELYEAKIAEASERSQNARDVETLALVIKRKSTPQHLTALEDVLARVPEQAKPAVQRAIEKQKQWLPSNFRVLKAEDASRAVDVGLEVLKAKVQAQISKVDAQRALEAVSDFQEVLAIVSEAPRGNANLEAKYARGLNNGIEILSFGTLQPKDFIEILSFGTLQPKDFIEIQTFGVLNDPENPWHRPSRQIKTLMINAQFDSLRNLAQEDPAQTVEIFAKAAESRLNAVRQSAERRVATPDVLSIIKERLSTYKEYVEFGQEISAMAQGIRVGETTVEELVRTATAHHVQVLEEVRQRIPAEAQQEFQRALDNARRVQGQRPVTPPPARPETPPRRPTPQQPGVPRPVPVPEQPAVPRLEPEPVQHRAPLPTPAEPEVPIPAPRQQDTPQLPADRP